MAHIAHSAHFRGLDRQTDKQTKRHILCQTNALPLARMRARGNSAANCCLCVLPVVYDIQVTHSQTIHHLISTQFWNIRLSTLESVRDQMDSTLVLNILHNLEQAQSTYAQAFIHVHRYCIV